MHDSSSHGTPFTMWVPLLFLAILAIFAGFVPFSHLVTSDGKSFLTEIDIPFTSIIVAIGLAGIAVATILYKSANKTSALSGLQNGFFFKLVSNKFYFDEMYIFKTKKIIFPFVATPAAWIDRNIIDGMVRAAGDITQGLSNAVKYFQSGKLQHYAMYFFIGLIAISLFLIYYHT